MTKPNISFREDPDVIEILKKVTGESQTAKAVRDAIEQRINNDNSQILHTLHIDMRDFVTVEVAAQLLKLDRSNVYRRIHKGKLKAIQPGGNNSTWYVYLDSLRTKLIPNVQRIE